jgi:hypothetical protein
MAPPTTICLDFQMFPDDTLMPLPFTLAGFSFAFYSGGAQTFVNESGAGKGLQFPDEGLKVKLPLPVTKLSITVAQFSTPVSIRLSNPNGGTVATATTAVQNTFTTFPFQLRRRISLVTLIGGNNEGVLSEICITF